MVSLAITLSTLSSLLDELDPRQTPAIVKQMFDGLDPIESITNHIMHIQAMAMEGKDTDFSLSMLNSMLEPDS